MQIFQRFDQLIHQSADGVARQQSRSTTDVFVEIHRHQFEYQTENTRSFIARSSEETVCRPFEQYTKGYLQDNLAKKDDIRMSVQ